MKIKCKYCGTRYEMNDKYCPFCFTRWDRKLKTMPDDCCDNKYVNEKSLTKTLTTMTKNTVPFQNTIQRETAQTQRPINIPRNRYQSKIPAKKQKPADAVVIFVIIYVIATLMSIFF